MNNPTKELNASEVLSDNKLGLMEAFPERTQGSNTTTEQKTYYNYTPSKEYRNGDLICSAHPLLVREIQEMHETVDKIEDYFVLRKKLLGLIVDNKYLSGIVTGVSILLIAYYTVL